MYCKRKVDNSCLRGLYHTRDIDLYLTQGNVGNYKRVYKQVLWLHGNYTTIIKK